MKPPSHLLEVFSAQGPLRNSGTQTAQTKLHMLPQVRWWATSSVILLSGAACLGQWCAAAPTRRTTAHMEQAAGEQQGKVICRPMIVGF